MEDLFGNKIQAIDADVQKMKSVISLHETREVTMAAYLDTLVGDRPAEGVAIMKGFENMDVQVLNLTTEMSRQ